MGISDVSEGCGVPESPEERIMDSGLGTMVIGLIISDSVPWCWASLKCKGSRLGITEVSWL